MIITIHIEDEKLPEITVADAREFPPVKGFVDADQQPKEETCKWTKIHSRVSDTLASQPHESGIETWNHAGMYFCPYCGKKIEVVE